MLVEDLIKKLQCFMSHQISTVLRNLWFIKRWHQVPIQRRFPFGKCKYFKSELLFIYFQTDLFNGKSHIIFKTVEYCFLQFQLTIMDVIIWLYSGDCFYFENNWDNSKNLYWCAVSLFFPLIYIHHLCPYEVIHCKVHHSINSRFMIHPLTTFYQRLFCFIINEIWKVL